MANCVLIVEDGSTLLRNLARALSIAGFEVKTADTVSSARLAFEKVAIDIVCIDINLPDGNGLALLDELREQKPDLDAVVMTGHDSEENRDHAARLNAKAFFVKPFPLAKFRSTISELKQEPARPDTRPKMNSNGPHRLILYSHDGFGLGHLKRNANIAARFVERSPGSSVLMIIGSPAGTLFEHPPGVDYIKLPSIVKTGTGVWESRGLKIDVTQTRKLRELTIKTAVDAFSPDLILVDHMATGVWGELESTLADVSTRQERPLLVVGFRDILDAPAVTRALWEKDGTYKAISQYYDRVFIYGEEQVFATAQQYGLSTACTTPVNYCGYVTAPMEQHRLPIERKFPERPLITVAGGGGYDAFPMMKATIKSVLAMGQGAPETICVAGPLMPKEQFLELAEMAVGTPELMVLRKVPTCRAYFAASDIVVTMGGYNGLLECLAYNKHVIVVPRPGPSAEQTMRAALLESKGLVCQAAADASASDIGMLIADRLQRPVNVPADFSITGVDRVVDNILGMLEHRVVEPHGLAAAHDY